MTIYLSAKKLFERGAINLGETDFQLAVTTCCKKHIVYEAEVGHIYYDSNDLQKVLLEFNITRCPICNSDIWDFTDVKMKDVDSNWSWAK